MGARVNNSPSLAIREMNGSNKFGMDCILYSYNNSKERFD
jgi:hypothetical protein